MQHHPFTRCVGVLLTLCLLLISVPVSASGVRHPQGSWTAHPPLHILRAPAVSPSGYNPAQIRRAYGFDKILAGGAGQIIGIVDAFDAPTIAQDLGTFVTTFHLQPLYGLPGAASCTVAAGPHPCFQVVYAQGKKPKADNGWALETSLDTQWVHATASQADILLVETQSASLTSLMAGVDVAVSAGARAVSMSWGGPEFATETNYDRHFRKAGVSFFASSGDEGTGQSYPAASPNVLSVGGTTLVLDGKGSLIQTEKGWPGSGGGVSAYEKQPAYQSSLAIQGNGKRTGPDVAFDADPSTGVAVYSSTDENGGKGGWFTIGGTSAASPQWAGIAALANEKRSLGPLSTNVLVRSFVYDAAALSGNYRDIKSGKNGICGANCRAAAGYDLVTGLGSPLISSLVPYLWGH